MNLRMVLMLLVLLAIASPMFAQGVTDKGWGYLASGFSMAFASGLCGLAQGKAVAGAAEAIARNPGAAAAIRFALLFGLVLIESLALYTLVIVLFQIK